jgi:hypothetical protein
VEVVDMGVVHQHYQGQEFLQQLLQIKAAGAVEGRVAVELEELELLFSHIVDLR